MKVIEITADPTKTIDEQEIKMEYKTFEELVQVNKEECEDT